MTGLGDTRGELPGATAWPEPTTHLQGNVMSPNAEDKEGPWNARAGHRPKWPREVHQPGPVQKEGPGGCLLTGSLEPQRSQRGHIAF